MARKQIVTTLERKYAQLLGEQTKRPSPSLTADAAHIVAVIQMFAPEWTGASVRPVVMKRRSRWGKRGAGIRAAVTVLKEAVTPLSAREIAIEVMLRRGEPDAPNHEIVQIMAGINYGLQKRIGREVVLIKGYPKRWLIMLPAANTLPIPGSPALP
jgi:hypothetical protein